MSILKLIQIKFPQETVKAYYTPKLRPFKDEKSNIAKISKLLEVENVDLTAGCYIIYFNNQIIYVGLTNDFINGRKSNNTVTAAAARHFYKYKEDTGQKRVVFPRNTNNYKIRFLFPINTSPATFEKILISDALPKYNERIYPDFYENVSGKSITKQIEQELSKFTEKQVFTDTQVKQLEKYAREGIKEDDKFAYNGKTYVGSEINELISFATDVSEDFVPF